MPWIPRGLRDGIVTSRYPRRADGYGLGFHGTVVTASADAGDPAVRAAAAACPTGAISVDGPTARLDRGRCILCGRCTEICPAAFRFDPDVETATAARHALVVPDGDGSGDGSDIAAARAALSRQVRALRRSVHIRHVDAGSDGAEEWEIAALTNPVYDVQRLGIFFTASPRHADLLLVTGAGSVGMRDALQETYEVMPAPKIVMAVGTDAISGGLVGSGYATSGGVTDVLPIAVYVPGSPPTPFGILHGILLALGRLPRKPLAGRQGASR